MARINRDIAKLIRDLFEDGFSCAELGVHFDLTKAHVKDIVKGKYWV